MKNLPVFGGLDYHQGSIQACVLDSQGRPRINRRCRSELTEVVDALRRCGDVRAVAIESSCGAAEFADQLRQATGWSVRLAHPGYVNRMKHNPDKSDHSDARLLADLCRVGYLPEVWLAPKEIRELRTLTRLRQSFVNDRKATKLRLSSLLRDRRIRRPEGILKPWTKSWLTWVRMVELSENDRWVVDELLIMFEYLATRIARAEAQLRKITADDPMIAYLISLEEIGEVTAWMIRAEVANIDRFRTGKQLCRFCGTSPRNASSGERTADSGLIKAGNPYLKATLIQAAHRLARRSHRWATFADRLERAGKPKSLIAAAVANRWVRWLFHRMREFQPAIS